VSAPDLDAVQARADKATPGPWSCWNAYPVELTTFDGPKRLTRVERVGPVDDALAPWEPGITTSPDSGDMQGRAEDFEFVAHARTDVPALVAELRAARQAREALRDLHGDLDAHDLTAAAAHRLRRVLTVWDKGVSTQ